MENLESNSSINRWKKLMDSWTEVTFLAVINIDKDSQSDGYALFSNYSFEIFDKVYEYSISNSQCSVEHLLQIIQLISKYSRPRELYMMVVEKIAGSGTATGYLCLSVLLYSMQLALLQLPSSAFLYDGCSIVLKAVLDSSNLFSSSTSTRKNASISGQEHSLDRNEETGSIATIELCLSFCEGMITR